MAEYVCTSDPRATPRRKVSDLVSQISSLFQPSSLVIILKGGVCSFMLQLCALLYTYINYRALYLAIFFLDILHVCSFVPRLSDFFDACFSCVILKSWEGPSLCMYKFTFYNYCFVGNWEVHPEVSDMIELQKIGMTSSSDLESKGAEIAGGEIKDYTNSTSSGVAGAQMKVIVSVGNKFELLMGHSGDDGD